MYDNDQTQAIGFLGGTFDPIHFGHLRPALEISEALSLKQLFLMPNHIAPHKSKSHCTAQQRSKMVELAIQHQPKMQIDNRELTRNKPSYTLETLKELKIQYPATPLCFIMGMDSLITFDSWFHWQEILNYCHLIISQRPGWHGQFNPTVQDVVDRCTTTNRQDLHQLQCGKIYFQTTSQFDISSTKIRQFLKKKQSIDYLVPQAVSDYIKANQLYMRS